MDIAGALVERLGDHRVDIADDGRLRGHVAQLLDVFRVVLGGLPGTRRGCIAAAVVLLNRGKDVAFGCQDRFNRQPRQTADAGDGFQVERVGDRHAQAIAFAGKRQEAVLPHVAGLDALDAWRVVRELGPVQQGDPELFRLRLEHVAGLDESKIYEDTGEPVAALPLQREGSGEVPGGPRRPLAASDSPSWVGRLAVSVRTAGSGTTIPFWLLCARLSNTAWSGWSHR